MIWLHLCTPIALSTSEMPYDGIDQDGDGFDLVDVDGDGAASVLAFGGDCNDRDPTVHPEALEIAGDHIDSNCDGWDAPQSSVMNPAVRDWTVATGLIMLAGLASVRWPVRLL